MKNIFMVAEEKMEWLQGYIAKVNKKAVKLGQREVQYKVISEDYIEVDAEVSYTTKVYNVEVDSQPIKLDGYKFVAVIDHAYEGGNIIHKNIDVELPSIYQTIEGRCEHCNTNRRRNTTVVLQDADGKFIQVGKSCLKDFLGYDVESKLKYSDLISSMVEEMNEGCKCGGNSYIQYYSIDQYLIFVEEEINSNGWVSKSSVVDASQSTSSRAYQRMISHMTNGGELLVSTEVVCGAMEWIRNSTEESEYMTNLRTICSNPYVREKDFGFVASLISSYDKYLDKKRKVEREIKDKANSQYVGKIGERRVFDVYVERVLSFDGMYGTSYITTMIDNDGNVIVWKGSSTPSVDSNDRAVIKGTIKEHSEYNGVKQTLVTRCAKA